jgi:hypothetical protein
MPGALDSFTLPLRFAPEERRDLARRLADRLGTGQAGGLSLVCEEVPLSATEAPGIVARLRLEGNAGEVKVRGLQQVSGAVSGDGRFRIEQRDAIGIGGLPAGAGFVLFVEEGWDLAAEPPGLRDHPAARLPALVRVEIREGSEEAAARVREEAFRAAGERVFPLVLKGEVALVDLPGASAPPDAKMWLRGRFLPPPAETDPVFGRVALVEDPRRSGRALFVRECLAAIEEKRDALERAFEAGDALGIRLAARRGLAPLFAVGHGTRLALRRLDRGVAPRAIDRAMAKLAWEATGGVAADPRPGARKLSLISPDAQSAGIHVGGAARLEGSVHDFASGAGARVAGAEIGVFDARGSRRGTIVERHLSGLFGGGHATVATFERRTAVWLAAPEREASRWLDALLRAL